jgi:hypothetical protein
VDSRLILGVSHKKAQKAQEGIKNGSRLDDWNLLCFLSLFAANSY